MGPDASKQSATGVDDATPAADDMRRQYGGWLAGATGPTFSRTKTFLLLLAIWATMGLVALSMMVGGYHSGLVYLSEPAGLACEAPYVIVGLLLLWGLTVSFIKEG